MILRGITCEQPRSSLDEVKRELERRTGVGVCTLTVCKALREAGIVTLSCRSGERSAVHGTGPLPVRIWKLADERTAAAP